MKYLIIFLFLSFISDFFINSVVCQKYEVKHIDYSFGLSNSQVVTMKRDLKGFVWIGTIGGGLYRWDGEELQPFSDELKHKVVAHIEPSSYSGIWVVVDDDIKRVVTKNETVNFDAKALILSDKDRIKSINEVGKYIVTISIEGKIALIDQMSLKILDHFILKDVHPDYFKIFQDNEKFHFFDSERYTKIRVHKNELLKDYSSSLDSIAHRENISLEFHKIHFANNKWLVQDENKLHMFSLDFKLQRTHDLGTSEFFRTIEFYKDDFFIGAESGLWKLDFSDAASNLTKLIKYPVNIILSSEDNLWVGSTFGFFQLRESLIRPLALPDTASIIQGYFDFIDFNGHTWAASMNNGVHIYDNGSYQRSIEFENDNSNKVRCFIKISQDSLLIGTENGLYLWAQERMGKFGGFGYSVISMLRGHDALYVGTRSNGVFRFRNGEWIQLEAERNSTIWCMTIVRGDLLLGTDNGFFILQDDSLNNIKISVNSEPILVTSIAHIKDGEVALGTGGKGIFIYDLSKKKISQEINESSGISSDFILFLGLSDDELWIGNNLGIDLVKLDSDLQVLQLSEINPKAGAETFLGSFHKKEDKIWVSTIAGSLAIPVDIRKSSTFETNGQIVIDQIKFYSLDGLSDTIITNLNGIEHIKIPFEYNNLKIKFAYPNYTSRKQSFEFVLGGYDSIYNVVSDQREIVYKKLPLGTYNFSIWKKSFGKNKLGDANFSFEFVPPVYQTLPFKIVIVSILFILAYALIRYSYRYKANRMVKRIKLQEKLQNDLRKEIVIDFHDEIGNHLAKIISLSGALKVQNLNVEHHRLVNRIESNAKELFTSTKDLIWSLKQSNCNLEEIFIDLKEFGNKLFYESKIEFEAKKPVNLKGIHLNTKECRDLKLIIKEALTNAFKHSFANQVTLSFTIQKDGFLEIIVSDNGIGFKNVDKDSFSGLSNIQLRSKRSDFSTNFDFDHQGGGTKISVKIKFNKNV